MKKTLFFIAAIAAAAVSCQKEVPAPETSAGTTDIKAYAEAVSTKVALTEDGTTHNMKGSWETTDVIIGFKADGSAFQFAVTAVDPTTGKATLSQTTSTSFTDGDKVYAIYNPGKTSADISESSLKVDFSEQTADVVPILMLANATVAGGIVSFQFENAASIVGVNAPVYPGELTEGKKVIKVTLSGHDIVSAGTVCVEGGKLVFKADAPKNFIEKSVSLETAASGAGYTTDPVYIVAPAGPIAKLSVLDNKNGFFEYTIGKTAEAGKYYDIKGKTFTQVSLPTSTGVTAGGVVWANANMGADGKATNMGDIYRWSETGTSICTDHTSTTGTFDKDHSAGFVPYLGELYCTDATGKGTYSKYNGTDGRTDLEPVDDLVQITYPGTGWKIPSAAEFQGLLNAGLTVTLNPDSNVGIKYTDSNENSLYFRGNAFVGKGGTVLEAKTRYWTSTISSNESNKTYASASFQIVISSKKATKAQMAENVRYFGYCIRPVKPVAAE